MTDVATDARPQGPSRLFALGFLTLFLELALIRYLAGNIWNLGYFPNFVLIAVFVGMGVGFIVHQRLGERASDRVFVGSAVLLAALVVLVSFFHPAIPGFQGFQGELGGELYFTSVGSQRGGALWFVLWFGAVVTTFAAISQRTAKLFRLFPPLTAYTLDIAGSCAGIVTFALASFLGLPAWAWFAIAAMPYAWGAAQKSRPTFAIVTALLLAAAVAHRQDHFLLANPDFDGTHEAYWSPYQKLEYVSAPGNVPFIFANGLGHQELLDAHQIRQAFYMLPHQARAAREGMGGYKRVLIIGGGTGNDVATALMNGAERVDVVEIDPRIAAIGRDKHPEAPYRDPRVHLVVDDGRAFMTRAKGPYDLIIFALTDSLVKVSAVAQLRLENFVFTKESAARAFELLSDDGDLVLYNYYRTDWLVDRLLAMLRAGSGREPVVLGQEKQLMILSVGKTSPPAVAADASEAGFTIPVDDWPFLYLKNKEVPRLYLGIMAGMTALVVALLAIFHRVARVETSPGQRAHGVGLKIAFVVMGVAFLLLETKSVVQFALLFGTTWINTSAVFFGILVLVLAANWSARLLKGDRVLPVVLVLLLASSLLPLVVPLSKLLYLEARGLRFVLGALLTFSPIFFANLLFSLIFRDQPAAEHLFGWNLIGATLGGVTEYTSMALGYRSLAIVVAALYAVAFALMWRSWRTRGGVQGTREAAT